jgi:hypothetical protein
VLSLRKRFGGESAPLACEPRYACCAYHTRGNVQVGRVEDVAVDVI